MIVECVRGCGARFDDEFRDTICPHETFAANNGRNEAFLEIPDHRPAIWCSPGVSATPERSDFWWMEPSDPLMAYHIVAQHENAIRVTNAYEVLAPDFVERLRKESGR